MTRIEHLLWILAEECAEVAHRASKAARFGMDNIEEGQDLTNEQRIWVELNDLIAAAEMIADEYKISVYTDIRAIHRKKDKVEKFLKYSEEIGTLEPQKSFYDQNF